MVKILRKSVQYIRRYSTKYAIFWPCRTWRSQISPVISGITRVHQILDDVAPSSPLIMRTARPWYCNSFSNTSATNASGISRHFRNIIWLVWQRPLKNWKMRYRSIICTKSAFIWWKDCENRSNISGDIWLSKPWPPYYCTRVLNVEKLYHTFTKLHYLRIPRWHT